MRLRKSMRKSDWRVEMRYEFHLQGSRQQHWIPFYQSWIRSTREIARKNHASPDHYKKSNTCILWKQQQHQTQTDAWIMHKNPTNTYKPLQCQSQMHTIIMNPQIITSTPISTFCEKSEQYQSQPHAWIMHLQILTIAATHSFCQKPEQIHSLTHTQITRP